MAVIECIVNQNVRDAGAANAPAMCWEVLRTCHEREIGLLPMPCPEIACLGPARQRPPGISIREALSAPTCRERIAALAGEMADRIQSSLAGGTAVLAVLGGNERSPGCAVLGCAGPLGPGSGVWMTALQDELRSRGLDIPFRGMRDADPAGLAEDLAWLGDLLDRLQAESAARSAGPNSASSS